MRGSDEVKQTYLDAVAQVIGADSAADMKVEIDAIERRYFREFDQRILDREAARLLPLGIATAMDRLGVCKATVYNRFHRDRKSNQVATA